jgi:small subunit ribosomal protein S2e
LVAAGKIASFEEMFVFSLPIKEVEIIEHFFPENKLKDEVMKILPVQKQTAAGQRTRFKAIVCVGDAAGHLGLGVKVAKEVATAIRGGIIAAKLSLIPLRRGYWGTLLGEPHTVPCKVTGKCGSVRVRLVPAPRGTGIVGARVPKRVMNMAGLQDVFTNTRGSTKTISNFCKATFDAIRSTYEFLTPDLWPKIAYPMNPYQVHTDFLAEAAKAPKYEAKPEATA